MLKLEQRHRVSIRRLESELEVLLTVHTLFPKCTPDPGNSPS